MEKVVVEDFGLEIISYSPIRKQIEKKLFPHASTIVQYRV